MSPPHILPGSDVLMALLRKDDVIRGCCFCGFVDGTEIRHLAQMVTLEFRFAKEDR